MVCAFLVTAVLDMFGVSGWLESGVTCILVVGATPFLLGLLKRKPKV